MKKFLFFAGIIAAMTSCTKSDVTDVNVANPDVITVGTYVGQSTKGQIFDQDAVEKSGFGLTAYYTGQSAWGAGFVPDFMYNQEVVYGINTGWTYDPIKFWPNEENDKVTFFAHAPYGTYVDANNIGNGVNAEYKSNLGKGLPKTEFTLQPVAADMIDFVAGQNMDMVRQQERVTFNLKHQLTRATFSANVNVDNVDYGANADGDGASYVVVKSMDIVGSEEFYTKGIYTHNIITTDTDKSNHEQDGTWEVSDADDYSFASIMDDATALNFGGYTEKGVAIPIAQHLYSSLFADGEYLFLLPPAGEDGLLEGGIEVKIVYDIVTIDSSLGKGHSVTESTYTVTLPAGTLAQGKAYNYQLTFDVTEVLVKANIVDWDEEEEDVEGGTVDPFDDNIDNYVTGLKISAEDSEVYVGKTLTLVADVTYADPDADKDDTLTWSENSNLISIVDNGNGTATVTGLNVGDVATVTLTSKSGVSASCNVAVKGNSATPTADLYDMEVGDEAILELTTDPEGLKLTFDSSNESAATIDQDGNVIALAPGKTTITVTDEKGNVLYSKEITVSEKQISVTSVTIGETISTLDINSPNHTFTAALNDGANVGTGITWSATSGNIDQNGNFTATETGEVTVTATSENNVSSSCTFNVINPLKVIIINEDLANDKLVYGTSHTFSYALDPTATTDTPTISWTVTDGSAAVNTSGSGNNFVVEAIATTSTSVTIQVTATADDVSKSDTYTFDAVPVVAESIYIYATRTLYINSDASDLGLQGAQGSTKEFSATISPDNVTDTTVTWSVDDTDVATINATTGLLTLVADGTVVITATCGETTQIISIDIEIEGSGSAGVDQTGGTNSGQGEDNIYADINQG
ncbi:MAG: Ig-like domain-containing protein [Rikenellaceae bacterium]